VIIRPAKGDLMWSDLMWSAQMDSQKHITSGVYVPAHSILLNLGACACTRVMAVVLCVCLSVTTLAATYYTPCLFMSKMRHHGDPCDCRLLKMIWIVRTSPKIFYSGELWLGFQAWWLFCWLIDHDKHTIWQMRECTNLQCILLLFMPECWWLWLTTACRQLCMPRVLHNSTSY
jgi:hypothetical protein